MLIHCTCCMVLIFSDNKRQTLSFLSNIPPLKCKWMLSYSLDALLEYLLFKNYNRLEINIISSNVYFKSITHVPVTISQNLNIGKLNSANKYFVQMISLYRRTDVIFTEIVILGSK